jgi:hypothetical protein
MTAPSGEPPLSGSQGLLTSHIPRRVRSAGITLALADRLTNIALNGASAACSITAVAQRLRRCATDPFGWKCRLQLCPRCQARYAKSRRREVERMVEGTPIGLRVEHLTLSLGADDLAEGRSMLLRTFGSLRRRRAWTRSVVGGVGQVEFLPAQGATRLWNVHLHVLVWSVAGLDPSWIEGIWNTLLGRQGLGGSSTVTPVDLAPGHRSAMDDDDASELR